MSMTNLSAVRKFSFDTGHRVVGQGGKCETLHGHTYIMEVYARAAQLNNVGMIIDFSVIKELVGNWIDTNWDHTTIIYDQDPNLTLMNQLQGKRKPFISAFNPTAENMAAYFLKNICPDLFCNTGVEIHKIVLWETPNCFVVAEI